MAGIDIMTESIPVAIGYTWMYFSLAMLFDMTFSLGFHAISLIMISFFLARLKQSRKLNVLRSPIEHPHHLQHGDDSPLSE